MESRRLWMKINESHAVSASPHASMVFPVRRIKQLGGLKKRTQHGNDKRDGVEKDGGFPRKQTEKRATDLE